MPCLCVASSLASRLVEGEEYGDTQQCWSLYDVHTYHTVWVQYPFQRLLTHRIPAVWRRAGEREYTRPGRRTTGRWSVC